MKRFFQLSLKSTVGLNVAKCMLVLLAFSIFSFSGFAQQEHPFLLVKKSDYDGLIAKSAQNPWLNMKLGAISKINTLTVSSDPIRIDDIMTHGALAYILDPTNRSAYATKIASALKKWDVIYAARPAIKLGVTDHNWLVDKVGNAFFNSVLALDIIHDELSAADLADIEGKLDLMAEYYYQIKFDPDVHEVEGWACWPLNRYGCAGIWEIYKGSNRTKIDEIKADYYNTLNSMITEDGIWADGTGYAAARLAHKRDAKAHFMDVVEFTGEGNYYNDPMMIKFYEWLFGYVPTPFLYTNPFGDAAPKSVAFHYGSPTYRAVRFSELAGGYAAWAHWPGSNPEPQLLFYLSIDEIVDPIKPVSRNFKTGGAWFMEDDVNKSSVSVAMWNPTEGENYGHAHFEINALSICAFGEIVLQNAGYNNAGASWESYSWTYIHSTAEAANTVQIAKQNHANRFGGGIVDGFVSDKFDYASGSAAQAISNGEHLRNLVFVHPDGYNQAYIVTFDEVIPNSSFDKVYAAWHPHANNATTVSDKLEYKFNIVPKSFQPSKNIFLNIFQATQPNSTIIKNGAICAYAESFEGKYLYSEYSPDEIGEARFVNIFFPNDFTHPKANMMRVSGTDYTGAVINHGGNVVDVALESNGANNVSFGLVSFRGKATLFRSGYDEKNFYFVRKGRVFNDGNENRRGFESDSDVSIHIQNDHGKINSAGGATISFYYPGVKAVLVDGQNATIIDSESDKWVKLIIPAGEHSIELSTISNIQNSMYNGLGDEIKIYPTNAKDIVTIELFDNPYDSLRVTDMVGRTIIQKSIKEMKTKFELDISGCSSGSYILTLIRNGNKISKRFFVS